MEAIKQKVTGGAYENPAKTKDGAFTTADSADAHTTEGTSADPNAEGSAGIYEKGEQIGDKAKDAGYQAEAKIKEAAKQAPDNEDEAKGKVDELNPVKK